jgi:hypothetical protein
MHNKCNNTIEFWAGKADKYSARERITSYAELAVVSIYIHVPTICILLGFKALL